MEEKTSKTKRILLIVLTAIIIAVLLVVYALGSVGVLARSEKETVTVHVAGPIIEEKRQFPFGPKVYCFLCRDSDAGKIFVLRATGKWFKENFSEDYRSINPKGVTIECIWDNGMSMELIQTMSQIEIREGVSFTQDIHGLYDATYMTSVELNLAAFISLILLAICSAYIVRKGKNTGKWIRFLWIPLFLTFLLLMSFTIF